jgi:hypothetical protein
MAQDLGIRAAGVFEGVRKNGEPGHVQRASGQRAFLVDGLSERQDVGCPPGGFDGYTAERITEDTTEKEWTYFLQVFMLFDPVKSLDLERRGAKIDGEGPTVTFEDVTRIAHFVEVPVKIPDKRSNPLSVSLIKFLICNSPICVPLRDFNGLTNRFE